MYLQGQESLSSRQSLESRQEDILRKLNDLKAVVEEMAYSLGVSLPRQKVKVSHGNLYRMLVSFDQKLYIFKG